MGISGKQEYVTINGKQQPYSVRKSRRARRLLLHVDIKGDIELVLPYWVSYKQGHAFVQSRKGWIVDQLQAQSVRARGIPQYAFVTGERIPCFGELFELVVTTPEQTRTTIVQQQGMLRIRGPHPRRALVRWYTKQAEQFLAAAVTDMAKQLDEHGVQVRINSARSQWGSCNPRKKQISFTWRLALAPPEVAMYVVAHEVAHLRYASHGKRFWQLVAKLDPLHEQHRMFLRERGHSLTVT